MTIPSADAIAQTQRIVDLRQRMLQNISAGKPSHEGITQEELAEAINGLRASRQVAGSRGGTASGKSKAAASSSSSAAKSLNDKLAAMGLDLD